ncbi:MAG: hypothetical protein JXA21_13210 [Anaerolineae bacterium]|nr:hypothetical protein [Anaerolineae bacterium]
METLSVSDLKLYFDAEERETAELVSDACMKTGEFLHAEWGLSVPEGCRVYVMTSWLRFAFQAVPWPHKVWLVLLFPFWTLRARRMWAFAGGWTLSSYRPPSVGVKPSRLIAQAAAISAIGRKIFVQESNPDVKLQFITCHELTHAFTGHLRLPAWLNEGVAMLAVDKFAGHITVLPETLALLNRVEPKKTPKDYRQLHNLGEDALVYTYARGYWVTRYFAEVHPRVLTDLLSRRRRPGELLQALSTALDVSPEAFWQQVDAVVTSHFEASQTVS